MVIALFFCETFSLPPSSSIYSLFPPSTSSYPQSSVIFLSSLLLIFFLLHLFLWPTLHTAFLRMPCFLHLHGLGDLESIVLEYISNSILEGRWMAGNLENNIICLGDIRRRIRQNHLGHNIRGISFEQFMEKYRQWCRRYYTFSFFTLNPRVDYAFFYTDSPPTATNLLWEELSEVCPWVLYYRSRGERHWTTLENMFRAPLDPYWCVGPF